MPSYNKIPCCVENNTIKIGKDTSIELDEEYRSHLLEGAYQEKRNLIFKPEYIEFEASPTNRLVKVKVDFIEERTNYNIIYSNVKGEEAYFIFRANKDRKINPSDELDIYLPLDKIYVADEHDDSFYSREIIFPNVARAKVTTKDGKSKVAIVKGETLIYDDLGVEDGEYNFILKQDKCEVVFSRKVAKDMTEEVNRRAEKGQYLTVSCYDEEPQHKMNTIFAKIKGFDEYVTLTVKNNFSVYKMPKFKVIVPRDAFELEKLEKIEEATVDAK